MPIYEYCCPKCDHKFDLLRSFSRADDPGICPECSEEASRLVSTFASFSKDAGGATVPVGGGGGCGGCSASICASCHT